MSPISLLQLLPLDPACNKITALLDLPQEQGDRHYEIRPVQLLYDRPLLLDLELDRLLRHYLRLR
jgi:hypothetical protein